MKQVDNAYCVDCNTNIVNLWDHLLFSSMVHSYHSYQQSEFTVRRPHVEGISSRVYILKINNADGLNS